jgi:hypothetical protein
MAPDGAPDTGASAQKEPRSLSSRVRHFSRTQPSRLHLHGAGLDAKNDAINTSNGRSPDDGESLGKPYVRNSILYDCIQRSSLLGSPSQPQVQARH